MRRGRPTKLTDELLAQAETYLATFAEKNDRAVPTVADFALFLNINRDTVYDWAKSNVSFSDIVNDILAIQENLLIQGSLTNRLNATISKLLLAKHGYAERQELTGKDGEKLFDDKEAKEKGAEAVGAFLNSGDTSEGE